MQYVVCSSMVVMIAARSITPLQSLILLLTTYYTTTAYQLLLQKLILLATCTSTSISYMLYAISQLQLLYYCYFRRSSASCRGCLLDNWYFRSSLVFLLLLPFCFLFIFSFFFFLFSSWSLLFFSYRFALRRSRWAEDDMMLSDSSDSSTTCLNLNLNTITNYYYDDHY